jgi:hypothetical protein
MAQVFAMWQSSVVKTRSALGVAQRHILAAKKNVALFHLGVVPLPN